MTRIVHCFEYNFALSILKKMSLFDLWTSNLSYQLLQCMFQPCPYLLNSLFNELHFHRVLIYRYPFETSRKLTSHISLQCSLNISSFPLFLLIYKSACQKWKYKKCDRIDSLKWTGVLMLTSFKFFFIVNILNEDSCLEKISASIKLIIKRVFI